MVGESIREVENKTMTKIISSNGDTHNQSDTAQMLISGSGWIYIRVYLNVCIQCKILQSIDKKRFVLCFNNIKCKYV